MAQTSLFPLPPQSEIRDQVSFALKEDIGDGDLTASLVDPTRCAQARLVCKEPAVICGIPWFDAACHLVDQDLSVVWEIEEGDRFQSDTIVCEIKGRAKSILTAERTAINFLQTLSGTATRTAEYVAQVAGTRTRILDTRKTIPGMRMAQKYAVAVGGGTNHRIGLFDGILIKENHIAASGSIHEAVNRARLVAQDTSRCKFLEVEVESLDQLKEAIDAKVTRIMLDNFDYPMMHQAVEINNGAAELEVSGNVEMEDLGEIARTGVDYVSIGGLTKHLQATDFSLRMVDGMG